MIFNYDMIRHDIALMSCEYSVKCLKSKDKRNGYML